jgi:hypothetical protein
MLQLTCLAYPFNVHHVCNVDSAVVLHATGVGAVTIATNSKGFMLSCFVHLCQCCGSEMFIPDPDPTIFCHPGSRILYKKERCKLSLSFFLPDQMITVVPGTGKRSHKV